MNTAERLHLTSHLPVPLTITEAIRIYKPDLNRVLSPEQSEEDSDIEDGDDDEK